MALPFPVEQFYGVLRDYNTTAWPVQRLLLALALAAMVAPLRLRSWSGAAVSAILGLLCFAVPPTPRSQSIGPVLWCAVGAQAAFLVGVQPDLGLIAAGLVAAALLLPSGRPLRTRTS